MPEKSPSSLPHATSPCAVDVIQHRINGDEFELANSQHTQNDPESGVEYATLPRADGGKDAWLALAGCFMLEALVWGFPFAFGVFQQYYRTHAPFSDEKAGIAAISTTASGLMYLSSPWVALVIQRYPKIRRPASFAGLAVTALSLIVASFARSTPALLATQGVLYALGGLTLYFPAMYVIDEWFIARKGLAFGVVWTGTGVAGATIPFLLQWLLDSYGFRTALRVWAIVLVGPACPPFLILANRHITDHLCNAVSLGYEESTPAFKCDETTPD